MAKVTRSLRIARVTETEISNLRNLLNDLQNLFGELNMLNLNEIVIDKYETLKYLDENDSESFLRGVCFAISNSNFEKTLFNLVILLDNCADLNLEYLDFNKDIKRGLELLELEKEEKLEIKEK